MAVLITDTMTDTNGVTLQSHTPESGGSYTKYPGYTADGLIFSNRLRGTDSASYDQYTHSATPPTADYDVQADFYVVTNLTSDGSGILGRADATVSAGNDTYYYAQYINSSGQWSLDKAVAGVFTNLGTYTQALSTSTAYALKLEMRGTTIKLYVDSVERISVTDSDISAAGKAGLYGNRSGDATGYHLDNFQVTYADMSLIGGIFSPFQLWMEEELL